MSRIVLGLLCKVLVVGGTTEVACVRGPPCLMEPVPGSSETDLLLAKAEPIRDGGCASGITYLRRKKQLCDSSCRRGVRTCERNSPADIEVGAGGGEEVLHAPEQRFPCRQWYR